MDVYKIPHEETSLLYYGCNITVHIWCTAQKQQTIIERRWRMLKTLPTNMAMAFSIFFSTFFLIFCIFTYIHQWSLSFIFCYWGGATKHCSTHGCVQRNWAVHGSLSPIILISQFIAITSHHSHTLPQQQQQPAIAQPSVSCTQHTQYGVAVAAVLKQSVIRRRCRRPPLNPICTSLVRIISLLTAASAAFASLSLAQNTVSLSLR